MPGSNILPAGYYKLVDTGAVTDEVRLQYINKFSDISYNFYNQAGQLLASIAPNGVKKLIDEGLTGYATLASLPFVTTYEYDVQGRLIANNQTDAGRTEFVYRKDGNIRFSQNSVQRVASPARFSYINYDRWGRAIESGEYVQGSITFASTRTDTLLLESKVAGGRLTGGTKQAVVKTEYDVPNTTHGQTALGYVQDEGFLRGAVSYTENADAKTWYNYDSEGRVSWVIKEYTGLTGKKTVDYTYDANGNVSKVDFQKNEAGERFTHEYEYDADGRLKVAYTSTATSGKKEQARYYYYLHGPLKRVELADNLQGIDYIYTAQGMLKAINHPVTANDPGKDDGANGISPDAFGMSLEYFSGDYTRSATNITSLATGGTADYSGSIMGQSWRSQKPQAVVNTYGAAVNNPAMVTYAYNNKYQFDSNKFGAPNFGSNNFTETVNANREYGLSYDANGNITALNRTNAAGTATANYGYTYQAKTNKLTAVSGYATSYAYDELGQMTSQVRTAGSQGYYVDYNVNGKVTAIYSNAAKTTLRVSFGYDESGNRIRKTDHIQNTVTYYVNDGAGNLLAVYDNKGTAMGQKEVPMYASSRLGTYNRSGNSYQYELTDHLGNVRVVIGGTKQSNGQADVVYYSDYYPYGSPLTLATNDYRYGYQGQYAEVDKETGWNNFELRMYDPAIGRWMTTDPYEQYDSPYVGMGNNPVSLVDPDGGHTFWKGLFAWIGGGFKGHFGESKSGDRKGEWFISLKTEYEGPGAGGSVKMDYGDNGKKFYPNGTISAYNPDLFDKWGDSENFLGKMSYNIADGFYLATSILPGSDQRHLNGRPSLPDERIGAFISTATSALPIGKVGQIIPKINAAQFSSLTAKTFLARLAPTTRGTVIKTVNMASGRISVKTFPTAATGISKAVNNNGK